jgi:hypothetical protein
MTTRVARAVKSGSAKPAPKHPKVEPSATPPSAVCLTSPSPDEIRLRAYQKWESAGKPSGDGVCFWLEAECELRSGG